ncbi:MAG: ATP-binding cassette domain-containing protein, partial [Gammaproteobacteria bacterium]|nr:ATP-binding cassette domain-containing protein [Gammaproteobacteria bacterium]
MIELQNVSIGFNGQAIFEQVNLTIEPQSTVAIMGPSGIGKTTLGRIILGLEPNFRGLRKVDGQVLPVLQSPTLLPWRSAIDNLVLIAQVTPQAALEAMA